MPSPKKHSTDDIIVHVTATGPLEDWKRFIELPYFRAKWIHLGLTDDDLRALQLALTAAPDRWPVVSGTGGLRKVRFAKSKSNRGKSGSFRIRYVYFEEFGGHRTDSRLCQEGPGNHPARAKSADETGDRPPAGMGRSELARWT
ncbi:MAG TPA: hypothetical protein VH475_12315 [Tepidisphaeraceae bacterium]|jgi:hypothetical protein